MKKYYFVMILNELKMVLLMKEKRKMMLQNYEMMVQLMMV
jgi:hypothetical protein